MPKYMLIMRGSDESQAAFEDVSFDEMLEMASLGAKVLQVRSVELAMLHQVPTYVRSSFDDPAEPKLGTLICDEEDIMEQQIVTGIAYSRDEAQITLRDIADKPGIAARQDLEATQSEAEAANQRLTEVQASIAEAETSIIACPTTSAMALRCTASRSALVRRPPRTWSVVWAVSRATTPSRSAFGPS